MAIYGIDLGTTNSLIGLHSEGYLSDLVPSCVNPNTGAVGKDAYEDMEANRSFKVDMSLGVEGLMPRQSSRYVLQELKRIAGGDKVKDVVISVPAYFSDNQRQATMESAEQAGLNVVGLVNEPTAAAMYIAQRRKSLFVVYDLGGGTFDVSVIDARFGAYDIQATTGRIVGGDDLDKAIMQYFVKKGRIPIHKMNRVRIAELVHYATKQKIAMQKNRCDFDVDLSAWNGVTVEFKVEDYKQLLRLTFAETVTLTKRLISAYIPPSERYEVLLVGGSTRCPFLREWLEEATGVSIAEPTYDPDRVVAQGAALYAHIMENNNIDVTVSDVTRALSIELADGTCSTIVHPNSKVPLSVDHMLCNNVECDRLQVNLLQGESTFASENECIGSLVWEYGEVKKAFDGTVIVTIDIDRKGIITFSVKELLKTPKMVVLDRKSANVK